MPKGYPKAKPQAIVQINEDDGRTLADYPMIDRQNADKIIGRKALVQLGQQYNMLISQMMEWPLDKLRQQIKYSQTNAVTNEWNAIAESEA